MAMFVHLAPRSALARIRRSGISGPRKAVGTLPGGVFAVPVTRDFTLTHQWLRELRRRGVGPIAGVYFRIADEERVWVGHYRGGHRWMTAARAVREFMSMRSRLGWEVLIPRRIGAGAIHRVSGLRQGMGWRYYPEAHGRRPCPCGYCTRGQYKAAMIRRRLARGERRR